MEIPDLIPAEGINIPLKVAFVGIKSVALIAFAHNSASPKFVLFEDHTQTRVIFSRHRLISEIEFLDVENNFGTLSLKIGWKNRLFDFTGAVQNAEQLPAIVNFFMRKNVTLGEKAQQFLAETRKT